MVSRRGGRWDCSLAVVCRGCRGKEGWRSEEGGGMREGEEQDEEKVRQEKR